MGLSKEKFMAETKTTFSPVNPSSSEGKVNILPTKEDGVKTRIKELSLMLFAEEKKDKEAKEAKPQKIKSDGFEPFVNPQPLKDALFVNGYNGNFAQKMELNRKGVERVLKIAHLDGKVVLTQFIPPRKSSFEAQGNELAAKRFRFFGEKTQKAEEENPYRRVVSIPEGWRIEINDGKIMEDLAEKRLTGEKLQTEFTQQFNGQFKQGLLACVLKEKLSSIKDRHFKLRVINLVLNPVITLPFLSSSPALDGLAFYITIPCITGSVFAINAFSNLLILPIIKLLESLENKTRTIYPETDIGSSAYTSRKLDSLWEYFMPAVEIDKVARSWAFLAVKGRKLVKEAKSDTK